MIEVTVYGASDDLVEIEGGIREEFSYDPDDDGDGALLAFSDGTVLKVLYDKDGLWRITPVHRGTASYEKVEATDPDDDYSDKVTLTGDLDWVVFGNSIARRKKA